MPGLSGNEVCSIIKETFSEQFIPVILLTGRDSIDDKVEGFSSGADDYITKPYSPTELRARVSVMLRIKKLTDDLRQTKNSLKDKEKQVLAMSIAGGTAHELGQPLTSIMLNVKILPALEHASPEFKEVLEAIEEQCLRMKKTVDNLFKLEKISSKDYVENLQILDLSSEE